jgi:ribosomal protein L37AE/L43A
MSVACMICNTENADGATVCELCGSKLEGGKKAAKPKVSLQLIADKRVIGIPDEGCVISREGDFAPEIFNHKFVSDPHCRIAFNDCECTVEDIGGAGSGSTNGTFLDKIRLAPNVPVTLRNDSELRIAHLMFKAIIEHPEPVAEQEEVDPPKRAWIIECPVCGARHEVPSESSSISECESCEDEFDKRAIARVRPRQVEN